jgi:hypothetical protein
LSPRRFNKSANESVAEGHNFYPPWLRGSDFDGENPPTLSFFKTCGRNPLILMSQGNIQNDITANVIQNGEKVVYQNQQSQQFDAEDFVDVYNDTVANLKSTTNQIKNTEEEIQEMLEEHSEAMQQIHALVESEPQNKAQLEADSVTVDDLNIFMQLQQQKKQKEQQMQQEAQVRNQLHQMKPAAEKAAEQTGKELEEIPEKRGEEKGVELNT